MKLKKIIFSVSALLALTPCLLFPACRANPSHDYVQELNYTESTEKIDNPDQGFYRPIYVKATESGITYNQNIVTAATRLYHLRIDISAFSAAVNHESDKPFTQAVLDGLNELLSYLKTNDKSAIVRFAYDPGYGGEKDKEPDPEMISEHIEQVCPVINGYQSTVTAIEVGLIGPWGEMHSSAIANAAHISPIIDTFLNNTVNVPVLVRTPKMIYDYLGITLNDADGYSIASTEQAYRLGLFNDGYLGSDSDLGTYTDRQKDIAFLSTQTEHLPYGGEVVVPDSPLHDIEVCLPEMYQMHLSYLDVEWDNRVIDKWKNSTYTAQCGSDEIYYGKTAFDYIQNRLGYRFVLTNSVFTYSDKADELTVKLDLKNVGFGNLNKTKHAQLIFTNGIGEIVFTQEVGDFTGNASVTYSAKPDLETGNYEVYLRLYGEVSESVPLYCLQFANEGLWNETLKANKIGSINCI